MLDSCPFLIASRRFSNSAFRIHPLLILLAPDPVDSYLGMYLALLLLIIIR